RCPISGTATHCPNGISRASKYVSLANSLIAGVGELPQGTIAEMSTMALHARLAQLALHDAGLDLRSVDAILSVSPRSDPYLIHAAALAEYLDLKPAVAWT